MKTIIITLLVIANFGIAKAGHQTSELNVVAQDHSMISVAFDGAPFWQPNPEYSFPNISGGNHKLKVWKWMPGGWACGPQKVLIYSGCINVPYSSVVDSYIDCHGNFVISSVTPVCPPPPPPPVCCAWHGEHGGHCGGGYYSPEPYDPWGGNHCIIPMSPQDFNGLQHAVEDQSFDSYKLKVVQQALYTNFLTTSQVRQLMCLLTFESSKLELAKIAYPRTVDKQNYYLVNSEFTFTSSIDELQDFIYSH